MIGEMLPLRGSCEYYTLSPQAVLLQELLVNTNYLYLGVYLFK